MFDITSFIFIFFILVVNTYAFCIAKNYFNMSIDIYNHKAFIKSIDNNYIIPSSAIREQNSYPPIIHLVYRYLEANNSTKYFSFVFFFLNQAAAFLVGLLSFDLNFAVKIMLISTLSTSLILDVRTYNARMLGVFLYNLLLYSIVISFQSPFFLIPIQIILCLLIVFTSRFAHQMIWFVLLPASLFTAAYDFLLSYSIAITLLYFIFRGHGVKIVKGHLAHLRYYFFNGVEFWAFDKYWREYDGFVETSRFDKLIYLFKSFKIFFRQPISIAVVLFFLFGFTSVVQGNYEYALYCLCSGLFFYFLTAFSDRVNKFIGDGFRYWEYLLIPFGICTAFVHSDLDIIIAVISLVVLVVTQRDLMNASKSIVSSGRSGDESLEQLCFELDRLNKKNVLTLPISLSNILSVKTNKKYFYAYTFFGFWFLNRKGIFPWFRGGNQNLLNSPYINYVVIDKAQVRDDIIENIRSDYGFTYLLSVNDYLVFKKNVQSK